MADQVATPGPAIAAARRAPFGELRTYPGVGHFDIYDGPAHEAVLADELAFLRRHLISAEPSRARSLTQPAPGRSVVAPTTSEGELRDE